MIRIISKTKLRPNDCELLKLAVISNLAYLFPENLDIKRLSVVIKIEPSKEKSDEIPGYCGYNKKTKTITMWFNADLISRTAPNTWERMYDMLPFVCHECVHVRQYLTEKVVKVYDPILEEESYYNSAFEIEAYGRMQWLMIRLERSFKKYYESCK